MSRSNPQRLCPSCRQREWAPGDHYCRPCRADKALARRLRRALEREFPRLLSGITKICHWCKRRLPIERFARERYNPDGYRYECRACRSGRRMELASGATRLRPWQRAVAKGAP